MRSTLVALSLFTIPALARGGSLAAQTVERADVAGRGKLRVTFDPRIVGWDAQFVDGARLPLGLPPTGDPVGAANLPLLSRPQQGARPRPGLPPLVTHHPQNPLVLLHDRP